MPSRTTLTLLHKEAKKRVFLQGTVMQMDNSLVANFVAVLQSIDFYLLSQMLPDVSSCSLATKIADTKF